MAAAFVCQLWVFKRFSISSRDLLLLTMQSTLTSFWGS